MKKIEGFEETVVTIADVDRSIRQLTIILRILGVLILLVSAGSIVWLVVRFG